MTREQVVCTVLFMMNTTNDAALDRLNVTAETRAKLAKLLEKADKLWALAQDQSNGNESNVAYDRWHENCGQQARLIMADPIQVAQREARKAAKVNPRLAARLRIDAEIYGPGICE